MNFPSAGERTSLKQKALDHLWMPYTQWNDLNEAGGPTINA